jgi:hypothetical protein
LSPALRDGSSGPFVFAMHGLDHCSDSGAHTRVVIACAEIWSDLIFDDSLGGDIGQYWLQTITDLDSHSVVLHKDEEDCAILLCGLAYTPRFKNPACIILERGICLHLRINGYQNLRGIRFLQFFQRSVEALGGGNGNHIGIIIEIT